MSQSIKTLLYSTIHRNSKSAAQLADETGISYSYLCRAGLPTDESGVRFPVEHLIPLMKAAGDFSVLHHLNTLCGFLTVKQPRGFKDKMDESEAVVHYGALCSDANRHLISFFKKPSPELLEETIAALQEVMQYSSTLQRRLKNHNQTEMEL